MVPTWRTSSPTVELAGRGSLDFPSKRRLYEGKLTLNGPKGDV